MAFLAKASTGVHRKAQIFTIMGNPKIGKTTLAASFPNSIFADLEGRSFHVNTTRLTRDELKSVADLMKFLDEIMTTKHDFKTLVVDSAEALEVMIAEKIKREHNITSIESMGYGKGYIMMKEVMQDIMHKLQALRDKTGMDVVIIAHTAIKTMTDPATNSTYDRYVMRMNDKLASVLRDLSDNILFATHKYYTKQDGNKTQAFGTGERVLFTEWRPAFDAGNTLNLPFEIPLSYEALKKAMDASLVAQPEQVKTTISEYLKFLKEPELRQKVQVSISEAGDDATKLVAIRERLKELTKAQRGA
jgi:hypothetical protein